MWGQVHQASPAVSCTKNVSDPRSFSDDQSSNILYHRQEHYSGLAVRDSPACLTVLPWVDGTFEDT
jgi:hypothetical protein